MSNLGLCIGQVMIRVFENLSRRKKQLIAVSVDYVLLMLAFATALIFRFDSLPADLGLYRWQMLLAPIFAIPIFIRLGLYRAVIRFMEDRVVFVVVTGVSLSVLFLAAVFLFVTHGSGVSRGVLLIYWLLAIVYVGGSRFLARSYFLRLEGRYDLRKRVGIYGAGRAGTQLAYALRASREYQPILFCDDNPALHKVEVAGLRVYPADVLGSLLKDKKFDELLLAMPSISKARRAQIIEKLDHLHCKVRLVPSMVDLVNGRLSDDVLRDVEIEDLLGRDSVNADPELLGFCINGKVVMVTGAGGSIGSELCRQIVRLQPKRLLLLEQSEFALYSLERELLGIIQRYGLKAELIALLGSVTDCQRNEMLMRHFDVQTVYHAAAYKHVPIVEHSPIVGIRNNALGTRYLAEAAQSAGVETFVLISTDKAVRPTNVMGASKRLAELILQAIARKGSATRFCMVRFGNVLGSSGSVVPLFRKQILAGGPLTLTHPDITRYFMTISEAAQLVIQAGSMGQGGEVFVLDMGKPVKIIDLARRMVHLSGLEVRDELHPDGDIAIEIIGLRPGEKLYEELLIGNNVEGTQHPLIMRAYEHELVWDVLDEQLTQLDQACNGLDYRRVLTLLQALVVEYQPATHVEKPFWKKIGNYSA